MVKATWTTLLWLIPTVGWMPIAHSQEAQTAVPGICSVYRQAGYLIVDETGNLVALTDYCRHQEDLLPTHTNRFWQAFTETADQEALDIANTLTPEEVVSYGSSICPFLEQGGTLQDLRSLQGDGDLPSGFEVAVTVAAIHAYCPTYRSQLGRE